MPAPIVIYDDEDERSSGDVAVMLGAALAVLASVLLLFPVVGPGHSLGCFDACAHSNAWSPGTALATGLVMSPPVLALLSVACCLFQVPAPGRIRPLRALVVALGATVALAALFTLFGLLMQLNPQAWAVGLVLLIVWLIGTKLAAQRASLKH
jgi:hypothetical protein